MARHRLFDSVAVDPIGWVSLGVIVYLAGAPVASGCDRARHRCSVDRDRTLGLDCASLAATGWVVGVSARSCPMLGVLVFAATLTVWDLSFMVGINAPWLFGWWSTR